jgi:hypothetical protein
MYIAAQNDNLKVVELLEKWLANLNDPCMVGNSAPTA